MAVKRIETKATNKMLAFVTKIFMLPSLLQQQYQQTSYKQSRASQPNVPIAYSLAFLTLIGLSTWNCRNETLVDAKSCSSQALKIDCHPDSNPNQVECLRRGCCWRMEKEDEGKTSGSQQEYQPPFIGEPSCFFPSDYDCYDFKSIELEEDEKRHQQELRQQHLTKDNAVKSEQNDVSNNNNNHGSLPVSKQVEGKDETLLQRQQQSLRSFKLIRTRKQSCPNLTAFTDHDDEASLIEVEVSVHGNSLLNIKISEPDRVRFEPSLPEIKLPKKKEFQKRDYTYDEDGRRWLKINQLLVGLVESEQHDAYGKEKQQQQKDKNKGMGEIEVKDDDHDHEHDKEDFTSSPSSSHLFSSPRSVLKVIHPASGVILFETDLAKLIYSRQFIQLPTYLPSTYIYGFGQHMSESLLKTSRNHYARSLTMFNYPSPPKLDGRTSYSSYPFYINLAQLNYDDDDESDDKDKVSPNLNGKDGKARKSFEWKRKIMATGGLMLNSNAMDILLHTNLDCDNNFDSTHFEVKLNGTDSKNDNGDNSEIKKEKRAAITWRLTGGIVNLFLFVGPSPHEVVDQYQTIVGRPNLISPWTLGYSQSRLNYRDLTEIKLAWAKTRYSGIPIESIWTDIDFLWRGTSYSLNNLELNQLVTTFQDDFGMHYVPIVDPAISIKEEMSSYEAYKLARSFDLFATYSKKDNYTNTNMSEKSESQLAIVTTWTESKKSALIDFTHPKIVDYLRHVLSHYKQQLNFDGLWLDMNEPEVFANQPSETNDIDNNIDNNCPFDESMPYLPGERKLSDRTLCMSANFYAGQHKDIHNLYAFYQSKAHFEAIKALNYSNRPFIVSRAQFVGQGKYSGTWLGDLDSSYQHLRWSVLGIIESNWFGQPLVGADICGFFGTTTDDLCARWFSLGAFYPLSRNHNDGSSKDQDPGSLGEIVQQAARVALLRRYSMLPYLYNLFYENYLKARPVIRSVLFEFFDLFFLKLNLKDLPQIDNQFMWGSAIMIAPILEEKKSFRSVYFPPGRWYDLSVGLPGTNMNEGPYNALKSNWPQVYLHKRVVNLRKLFECKNEKGCWLKDQFTPLGSINIYLRGGQIIPTFYEFDHQTSINSLWKNASFFLEIGLDENQSALGSLYWDDGQSDPEAAQYNYADLWVSKNRLVIGAMEERSDLKIKINGFIVYGVEKTVNFTQSLVYKDVLLKYNYFGDTKILTCLFVSPSDGVELSPLSMKRFDSLIFSW